MQNIEWQVKYNPNSYHRKAKITNVLMQMVTVSALIYDNVLFVYAYFISIL